MPYGTKAKCTSCGNKDSDLWRRSDSKETICNECFMMREYTHSVKSESETTENKNLSEYKGQSGHSSIDQATGGSQFVGSLRKSSRLKPSKFKSHSSNKTLQTKGRNRRFLQRKNPIKSIPSVATTITSDFVFHDGCYMQVGDIVSVMDEDDNGVYFAQIRGFLQDQFCEKSVVITWLVPTINSPKDRFDSNTYVLGPEEDLPRSLDYFQFVCHAPSDYFKAQNSPYPTNPLRPKLGYISTAMGGEIGIPPSDLELYGLESKDLDKSSRLKSSKQKRGRKAKRHYPS